MKIVDRRNLLIGRRERVQHSLGSFNTRLFSRSSKLMLFTMRFSKWLLIFTRIFAVKEKIESLQCSSAAAGSRPLGLGSFGLEDLPLVNRPKCFGLHTHAPLCLLLLCTGSGVSWHNGRSRAWYLHNLQLLLDSNFFFASFCACSS